MSIIGLIVVLIIVGVIVYVVNNVVPMDARFKMIINAIIIIVVLLWVCDELGLFHLGTIGRPLR